MNIVLDNISKFYGEILGVNKVNLTIPPGVTSLVGPNGSGKTTLMNLISGLLQPTRGCLSVCGLSPKDPEKFFRATGYATAIVPKVDSLGWINGGIRFNQSATVRALTFQP